MNFSLVNPSVPEFPNSDFFIPIFHYEEKRNPPRAREAYDMYPQYWTPGIGGIAI